MTKKDYELIAYELRLTRLAGSQAEIKVVDCIANALAKRYTLSEPKFDRNKFLQACGIED